MQQTLIMVGLTLKAGKKGAVTCSVLYRQMAFINFSKGAKEDTTRVYGIKYSVLLNCLTLTQLYRMVIIDPIRICKTHDDKA